MAEWLIAPVLKTGIVQKQRTIEGSNPSLSFCSVNRFFYWFCLVFLFRLIKGNGSAREDSRARKKRENRLDITELKKKTVKRNTF